MALLIKTIKLYQKYLSPVLPRSCRYEPSCSNYAILAIKKHGALKGGIKAAIRILKCNPLFESKVDLP